MCALSCHWCVRVKCSGANKKGAQMKLPIGAWEKNNLTCGGAWRDYKKGLETPLKRAIMFVLVRAGWVFKTQLFCEKGSVCSLFARFVHKLVLYELFLPEILHFPFWKRHFNFPSKFPRDFILTCWDRESLGFCVPYILFPHVIFSSTGVFRYRHQSSHHGSSQQKK